MTLQFGIFSSGRIPDVRSSTSSSSLRNLQPPKEKRCREKKDVSHGGETHGEGWYSNDGVEKERNTYIICNPKGR
jgi:hypothetical protein